MSNPFDQFDVAPDSSANPFDQFDSDSVAPASKSGFFRKAADLPIGFASGAVGAVKSLSDAFGANNAVSRGLKSVSEGVDSLLTPEAKAAQQRQSAILEEAKGKGFVDQVAAGGKAFMEAPVQTAVQGLGSVAPFLAAQFIPGVGQSAAAARMAQIGMGVGMGAGAVKGSISDEVAKREIAAGKTPEQAAATAEAAQSYGGPNTDQIALGAGLGVADAAMGVTPMATKMLRQALGKEVLEQGGKKAIVEAAEGRLQSGAMGALKEVPVEFLQGGQEQVAANVAAQRAGYEAGTFDGAFSQGTLEGLASAGPGAGFGIMSRNRGTLPPATPPAPDQDTTTPPPMGESLTGTDLSALMGGGTLAGTPDPLQAGLDTLAPKVGSYPGAHTVGTNTAQVDPNTGAIYDDGPSPLIGQQADQGSSLTGTPMSSMMAGNNGLTDAPVAPPSEQLGINPGDGVVSKVAAQAVNTGVSPAVARMGSMFQSLGIQSDGPVSNTSIGRTGNQFASMGVQPDGETSPVGAQPAGDAPLTAMGQRVTQDEARAASKMATLDSINNQMQQTPLASGGPSSPLGLGQIGQAAQQAVGSQPVGATSDLATKADQPVSQPPGQTDGIEATQALTQGTQQQEAQPTNAGATVQPKGIRGLIEQRKQQEALNANTAATPVPAGQQTPDAGAAPMDAAQQGATQGQTGVGAVDGAGQSESAGALTQQPVLQNRDRSNPASITQMQSIASNPDYGRLGFSRDFANGAPVVAGAEQSVPAQQLGKQDTTVAVDGTRIPVQYAVVDAGKVLTSNNVDGTSNTAYGDANTPAIRAIAGNGRVAGLTAAYKQGTAAQYKQELMADTALHGVPAEVIQGMQNPVLVRVMPQEAVTANIGDLSNTQGNLSLSAVEQAKNDVSRVNLAALEFDEAGGLTQKAVRQFVQAMPKAEQGGLIDTNGQSSKQAVDRLQAAVFAKAYGNDQLIRLFAQAQDPEARLILSAMAQLAPKIARLEGAGALDIRPIIAQAAEIAVNARREGKSIALAAKQMDMAADPAVGTVLDLFASSPRSNKPIIEAIANAMDFAYAEASKPDEDMFGPVEKATRDDVINTLKPKNEPASQTNLEQPTGRVAAENNAVGKQADTGAAADTGATEAGGPAQEASGQVTEPGAEYSVRQQFSLFGDEQSDQLQLFIDRGPDPVQAGPGAVAAQRDAVTAIADIHATKTILAAALTRDYAARQRISLVGQKVASAEDLAVLAQVYRDPRFETFRVVFVDANNKVVSQLGLTSRLPASAAALVGTDTYAYLNGLSATAKTKGATGYYLLHNHPSGQARASTADVRLTNTFDQHLPGLKLQSHVVIDTNEYSTIEGGFANLIQKDFGQSPPLGATGVTFNKPEDVVAYSKRLQAEANAVTLIATDAQFTVKGITTIPAAELDSPKGLLRLKVARALMRLQSSNVFAVGRKSGALAKLSGIVVDAIHIEESGKATSLAARGIINSTNLGAFPSDRRTRVTADSSPEFAYLRFDPSAMKSAGQRVAEGDLFSPSANAWQSDLFGTQPEAAPEPAKPRTEKKAKAKREEQTPTLTSPTPADIEAQQDRAKRTERTVKAEKTAADEQAKRERERKEIAQASVAAADSFELGGDAEGNLTGQGDLADTKPATVENFGEKLPPARRAMAAKLGEELTDDKIASMPLSQIWPAAENDAIEDTFVAAVAHVMREAIPAKPRSPYKVKSWVGKVRLLRGFAADIMSGKVTKEKFVAEMGKLYTLKDMLSKIKLLEQIDRADWARIGDVMEAPNAIRYEDNKQVPEPSVSVSVDGRNHWLRGSGDIAFHLDGIKAMLGTAAPENKMQFEIRQESRGDRKVFINKKGDKEYRRLMTFDTAAEARAAVQNQYTELVAAWEGVKARDNITERDVRSDVNRDRTGKDHRQGMDVSAEEFESQFGFRGGEFGSWVKQGDGAKERQFLLNNAYDALMDLSDLLGIPPKAISLEGSLGIAFGSRGSGWASAHFEPSNVVINLTKTRGAGSLAHEWFHALDNYFARKRGGEVTMDAAGQVGYRNNNYITHKTTPLMVRKDGRGSPLTKERLAQWRSQSPNSGYLAEDQWHEDPKHKAGVRVEVERAFNDLVAALNASPMLKRARVLDGVKENGDGYWSRTLEMAARSFENFVQTRMMEQGYHNDFLANVKAAPDVGKNTERYPYLMPEEVAPIAAAFDSLFGTIKTKESGDGKVALFSQNLLSQKLGPKPTLDQIERFVQRVQDVAKNIIPVTVVGNPAQINVLDVPAGSSPSGALIDGRIYLFADNIKSVGDAYSTLFHEIFHLGLQKVIPAEAYSSLLKQFAASPLVAKYVRQWKQSPEGLEKAGTMPAQAYEALATEEALAMVSETLAADQNIGSVKLPGLVKRMLAWFAQVADQLGFPANFGNWIRGLTQTAAERFVSDMTRAALGGDKNLAKTQAKYGTQAAQLSSQNRLRGGEDQTTTSAFKRWFGDWESAQKSAILNGPVVASVSTGDVPPGGYKVIENWAAELFAKQGGAARREGFGDVLLDYRAAKTSMAHSGANLYKKAAFAAVKDVIERGALVLVKSDSQEDSFYFSAPVDIDGRTNIETVLVHRDPNTQRMYLHSVTTKENLLNQRVSSADAEASGRSGSTDSGEVASVIQSLLKVNTDNTSKVVDASGKPLVVYHGTIVRPMKDGATMGDIAAFDRMFTTKFRSPSIDTMGSWFSTNPGEGGAEMYSGRGQGSAIYPVYLSIKNPQVTTFQLMQRRARLLANGKDDGRMIGQPEVDAYRKWLEATGKDGIKIEGSGNDGSTEFDNQVAWIALEPGQIKSATGNNGDFDPKNPDIRFRQSSEALKGAEAFSVKGATADQWDGPLPSKWDDYVFKFQNKLVDLKRVTQNITKWSGQLADDINVYLQEELYHGRTAKRVHDFVSRELNPALKELATYGMKLGDLEEYMHARHAEEANKVIAQRNPGVAALQDGGSGMTTAVARQYLASLPAADKMKLDAVAKKMDAIMAKTSKLMVDYELESQDTIDGWDKMYRHYIPLHREDKEGGRGLGQGFSVKGRETKGRTGSTRKVVDIIAHIAEAREKTVVRGEKNRVSQALVGLAKAHPNPDFWKVGAPPKERVFNPATGLVEDRTDPLYKSRDNVVVSKRLNAKGFIEEDAVTFQEDDERAVRLAKALKNLDTPQLEGLMGTMGSISRYFAAINTQYNPVFGVVNLVRDIQGAAFNLGTTPLAGKQAKVSKDALSALYSIYTDLRATRKGGQANSPWATVFEQFQEDGGQTGFRQMFETTADRGADINKAVSPDEWMNSLFGKAITANGQLKVPMRGLKKGGGVVLDWLSDYNDAMENAIRVSAYKNALDEGMSREQAASIAKNITVNFNRKGNVTAQAGALYAFFNAAMQGTARLGETLFDMEPGKPNTIRLSPLGKKIVYGGMLLGSLQALALAGAGFGDEEPPEFVRERNLVIPIGDKDYVTIPMPLGLHVIPGIGRHATEFALSGFKNPAKRVVSMTGMLADAFNPIGNAGLSMQTLAPTALDPLAALTENKDWTGKPIARTSFNKHLPGFTQHKDSATWIAKMTAEAINTLSGGNDYVAGVFSPTPDQIDYLIGQLTGGVGRELSKFEQTTIGTVTGEDVPLYKMPLVGRFAGSASGKSGEASAFYSHADKINRLETEIKGLLKDGETQRANELRQSDEAKLIARANMAERVVRNLTKMKRDMVERGEPREKVRAVEERITETMARFNRAAEAAMAD